MLVAEDTKGIAVLISAVVLQYHHQVAPVGYKVIKHHNVLYCAHSIERSCSATQFIIAKDCTLSGLTCAKTVG
jgi:hypothetical protein